MGDSTARVEVGSEENSIAVRPGKVQENDLHSPAIETIKDGISGNGERESVELDHY